MKEKHVQKGRINLTKTSFITNNVFVRYKQLTFFGLVNIGYSAVIAYFIFPSYFWTSIQHNFLALLFVVEAAHYDRLKEKHQKQELTKSEK
ncbi:MAG: hypothetical protein JW702_08010 [Clostridiales bacterium]|nr:hypothetical protein [Clostridiales bacterium]